jgi:hypothetical protein
MDGKHICIRKPARSGSLFFNYKRYFSTVLLAICDFRYRFVYVDIGSYGTQADGGIFNSSVLKQLLNNGQLDLPNPSDLPGSNLRTPSYFVADAAFTLSPNVMKPFGGSNLAINKRVYNYR